MTDTNKRVLWETHGVHVGTGDDHVKHGVDEIEEITERAIELGHPNITFVIHTPRLTRFRYAAEKETNIKFIRGNSAYFEYPARIQKLKDKYSHLINIKYGIELEWLGSGLGLQWNRSKVFQAAGADFVIGSVHFSREGIPYDGSQEETDKLIEMRGGVENYWAGYIEEMIEMIDCAGHMIQVVGHIDLPKLYVPTPAPIFDLDNSQHFLAERMRVLLELISENNLAIDVNLAGLRKGCGIYPDTSLLVRAKELEIPIAMGTDTHHVEEYGINYADGIDYVRKAGYAQYVSFSRCVPEKRPLLPQPGDIERYRTLNLGIKMLNRRFAHQKQNRIPKFSFGGHYRSFLDFYNESTSLGDFDAIRIRKENKSVTISTSQPERSDEKVTGLLSLHQDKPGVLSILFNTLASEEINVKTAYLNANEDGTGAAFLTLSGDEKSIQNAVEFIKGTAADKFITLEFGQDLTPPPIKKSKYYLLAVDGVELPLPVARQMIFTVHNNSAGILLILLSALASRGVNIKDLQLGERGEKGYAALSVEGDERVINELLSQLGPQFHETSHLLLNMLDE